MPSTPHFDVACAADGHHRNLASDRRKKVVTEGRGSIGDLLKAARRARASNEAVFLSGQHYMEMSGIRDPRQRQGIATVMLELSEFRTLLPRSHAMRFELETVLDLARPHYGRSV